MIRETESRLDQSPTGHSERDRDRDRERERDRDRAASISHNMNQGMEDVRQRVSKIFSTSKPNNLGNLQNIFKKK